MNRGEVWLVDLEPTRGAEIRKQRPAVIVSRNDVGALPLRIVVPFTDATSRHEGARWLVRVDPATGNGLLKPSFADTFQVRSVGVVRFIRQLGALGAADLSRVDAALHGLFGPTDPAPPTR